MRHCSQWPSGAIRYLPHPGLVLCFSKLDVSSSSASLAATWNWIPAPSSVVLGDNHSILTVQQDGFVELPAQLIESSGTTEESPLLIEPSECGGSASCCCLLCTTLPTDITHTHGSVLLLIVQDPLFTSGGASL